MSWKETDPITLWRTHSTLPVPKSMLALPRSPEENLANQVCTARKSLWSSLNEMNAEQRRMFFGRILFIWPYKWERRAIKWPQSTLISTNLCCAGYIATKVCADVFLVDPKIGWMKALRSMPTLMPNLAIAFSTLAASTFLFQHFVYDPFVEHEGLLSAKSLFWRIAGINFMTGTVVPCLFAPVAAHFHNLRMLEAAGKPPIPANALLDMFVTCWESTRSVWRKLPLIVAINFASAALAAAAMTWGRDRLHNTMNLDSELIRSLLEESEEHFQDRSAVKAYKFIKQKMDKYNRIDKELFLHPPIKSTDGPKWRDKTVEDNEAQMAVGLNFPMNRWKEEEDDK